MKTAFLLALVMLTSCALGIERLWAKGDVLLEELQNGKDELHIVYFYNPVNSDETYAKVRENQRIKNEVLNYLNTLSEDGQNQFPTPVYYSVVESTDPYNQNLMYKLGVDEEVLETGPVVVALRHGRGYRHSGPKLTAYLKKSVNALRQAGQ